MRAPDVPFDAPAVERGVGFFETVLLVGRRAVLWNPHLARLYGTLRRFGFPEPGREALEASARAAADEAALPPGEERGLRLAWIATGPELELASSWRLDVSVRAIPETTRARRAGCRAVTLRADLRRDTPDVKSTSYFAAVAGLRIARRNGGDEGLFTGPDGTYLEGTSTSLIAWNGGAPARAPGGALPSVTAAAFLAGSERALSLTAGLLAAGSLLCGSLTLAAPIVALDAAPCAVPEAMTRRIRTFNERLRDDPELGTTL
ncbi:MAG TPA: aminotransferase class IV [Thermoanaerobaculia bacterium]|nr:aminotransferase class IV [Thermoanaerobaculia bacterium]